MLSDVRKVGHGPDWGTCVSYTNDIEQPNKQAAYQRNMLFIVQLKLVKTDEVLTKGYYKQNNRLCVSYITMDFFMT